MIRGALVALVLFGAIAHATPPRRVAVGPAPAAQQPPRHDGAHARVTFGQTGRAPREVIGRRDEPLTPEEDTAKQIQRLLRGPLHSGVTGLYVADAHTGETLFSVNAEDALNPASNVKMISTATALDLVGADFRYSTRVLGPEPDEAGVIHGNVYLLGTWDPTLVAADFDDLAAQLAAHGVHALDGNVVVGSDPSRDGLYRPIIPIDIRAGQPGELATATAPPGFDLVAFKVTARTAKTAQRPRLTYTAESTTDAAGHTRVMLVIGGTIGRGGATTYSLVTKEQTAAAAHFLRSALRAHQISVTGDVAVAELGDFIGDAVVDGELPSELARHDSAALADIVLRVNKWSINWLADRVIMTTAAIAHRDVPTMQGALDAMYAWLDRRAPIAKQELRPIVDTGSGLSYHTRITTHELVSIVRGAGGFTTGSDPTLAKAWLASLSIGGTDGTLTRRFRTPEVRGRLHAKTGSLSTVIALSGVLEVDPQRPLAFSIVTNTDHELSKGYVRRAHEQLVGLLCKYVAKTAKHPVAPPVIVPEVVRPPAPTDDFEESEPEPALDAKPLDLK